MFIKRKVEEEELLQVQFLQILQLLRDNYDEGCNNQTETTN